MVEHSGVPWRRTHRESRSDLGWNSPKIPSHSSPALGHLPLSQCAENPTGKSPQRRQRNPGTSFQSSRVPWGFPSRGSRGCSLPKSQIPGHFFPTAEVPGRCSLPKPAPHPLNPEFPQSSETPPHAAPFQLGWK